MVVWKIMILGRTLGLPLNNSLVFFSQLYDYRRHSLIITHFTTRSSINTTQRLTSLRQYDNTFGDGSSIPTPYLPTV